MRSSPENLTIRVSAGFCAAITAFILIFPANWVLAWLCTAAVHELGHYVAVRLCGGRVFDIRIGYGGACMETELSGSTAELISAAAGPMCGACLIFLAKWLPRLAICAMIQTAYNLLPMRGFDGGRILRRALNCILPTKYAYRVFCAIEWLVLISIIMLSVAAIFLFDLGLVPIVGAFVLVCRTGFIKIPCKRGKQIVQ